MQQKNKPIEHLSLCIDVRTNIELDGKVGIAREEMAPKTFELRGYLPGIEEPVVVASGYFAHRDYCFEIADAEEDSDCAIAEAICGEELSISRRYANEWGNYACFLSRIRVPEEYRGRGISGLIQRNIRSLMLEIEHDLCGIYAIAGPWELHGDTPAFEKRQQELIRYYKKFGFRQIKKSPVLWMPVDEPI